MISLSTNSSLIPRTQYMAEVTGKESVVLPHLPSSAVGGVKQSSAATQPESTEVRGQPAATGQSVMTCALPQIVSRDNLSQEEAIMRALDQHVDGLRGRGRRKRNTKKERQKRREAQKLRMMWFDSKSLVLRDSLLEKQSLTASSVIDRKMILSSFHLLDKEQKYMILRDTFFSVLRDDLMLPWCDTEMRRFWSMLCGENRSKMSYQAFSLLFKVDRQKVEANQKLFIEMGLRLTENQPPRVLIPQSDRFATEVEDVRGLLGPESAGQGVAFSFGSRRSSDRSATDVEAGRGLLGPESAGQGVAFSFGSRRRSGAAAQGGEFTAPGAGDHGPSYSMRRGLQPAVPTVPKPKKSPASLGREQRYTKKAKPEAKPEAKLLADHSDSEEDSLTDEEERGNETHVTQAAIHLQAYWRGHLCRKILQQRRRERCAIRIQASWRGHLCRQLLWRKRAEPYARRLQAAYRGKTARRFIHVMKLVNSYQHKVANSRPSVLQLPAASMIVEPEKVNPNNA